MQELVIYESFKRRVITRCDYKTLRGINNRIERQADKVFGIGAWEKVSNPDQSLANTNGWTAVETSEDRRVICIETEHPTSGGI